jgi:hypothetical protein
MLDAYLSALKGCREDESALASLIDVLDQSTELANLPIEKQHSVTTHSSVIFKITAQLNSAIRSLVEGSISGSTNLPFINPA